ncbi:Gfo/Idh/MocA family oxidoreductase [Candidatus Puniceispirillum sp.]|nr:Gfo/Idh/MocA family oxidoreductase [Candidatus Puniceispirillum sp.]
MIGQKRIALIGSGAIAEAHKTAMDTVGLSVVHCASSPRSKTIGHFADRMRIPNIWEDPLKLLHASDQWDGVIIASSINSTQKLLDIAILQNKPILVEKPVGNSSLQLSKYKIFPPPSVMVGFNRRHYSTVLKAKEFVKDQSSCIRASINLPEQVFSDNEEPYAPVLYNSIHGLDILRFLLGDIELLHVEQHPVDPLFGRVAIAKSSQGHICSINLNWNSPAKFSLTLESADSRILLEPFETYQHYHGMTISEPTKSYPVRKYSPTEIHAFNVFDNQKNDIKPGFLGQSLEYKRLVEGFQTPSISANLKDAYNALNMAEELIEGGTVK